MSEVSAPPQSMLGAMLLGPEHIEVQEVPVVPPGPGEVLLRIRAATTCGTDVKVFRRGGHPRMLQVPTLFGHEMAGVVAAIGAGVTGLSAGDAVVVVNSAPCLRCDYCLTGRENLCADLHYLNGAFAEYLHVPERFVLTSTHAIPAGLSFDKAALTEPLACVLHGIGRCNLAGGREIIVYGAGPVGLLFTAALARDGHRVILADPNQARLEAGAQLGAEETIAVSRGGEQAQLVTAATCTGRGAQLAIDCTGVPEVWGDALDSVRPGGEVLLFGGCAPGTAVALDTHRVHYSELTVKGAYHHRPETVRGALELLAEEDFHAELLLTCERPIDQVEDALRSMMAKEALKVVIRGRDA